MISIIELVEIAITGLLTSKYDGIVAFATYLVSNCNTMKRSPEHIQSTKKVVFVSDAVASLPPDSLI